MLVLMLTLILGEQLKLMSTLTLDVNTPLNFHNAHFKFVLDNYYRCNE